MRLSSRTLRNGAAALAVIALAGCVPPPAPTPTPAPAPAPVPTPSPVPSPTPLPFAGHWMDAPATPGDWTYRGGQASFGQPGAPPLLTLRCDRPAGAVEIARAGSAVAPLQMRVLTEFQDRALDAVPARSDPPTIAARIPTHDPLLDAMAFSKGRFAVEIGGLPTLYAPSWAEVTRVIEDCR
jgi:hypothetical protein